MIVTLALSLVPLWMTPIPLPLAEPDGVPSLSVTNLKHNLVAVFTMTGATPGRSCGLVVSLTGSGPSTVSTGPCPSLTVDLSPRFIYLGTVNSDGTGKAIWTQPIPPNAGGRTVWAQGISFYFCEVSNLLNEVVQ